MPLSVTRQYVEVLVPDTGGSGSTNVSGVDTLSLAHQATVVATHVLAAADTVSLTDEAGLNVHFGDASDTLTISSQATRSLAARRSAADNLFGLSQQSTLNIVVSRQVADTLGLSDVARASVVRKLSAEDALRLRDNAGPGLLFGDASDSLQIVMPVYDPATGQWQTQYRGLQDQATASIIHGTPSAAQDTLSLSEQARGVVIHPDAIDCRATDSLPLVDSASVAQSPFYRTPTAAGDALALTQRADAVLVKPVADRLVLADCATVTVVRSLTASDTLVLGEAVGFVVEAEANKFQYHPFIGTGVPGAPTPPPATLDYEPVLDSPENTLLYPPDSPYSDTLTLRSPEFGNKDRLQFNRVSRETRGGTLVVYADPMWPKVQVQVLTFTALTESQARGLLDFLAAHLGEEIGLVDWERRRWRGIVTNPTDAVVQDGRNMYTANLELEGTLAT